MARVRAHSRSVNSEASIRGEVDKRRCSKEKDLTFCLQIRLLQQEGRSGSSVSGDSRSSHSSNEENRNQQHIGNIRPRRRHGGSVQGGGAAQQGQMRVVQPNAGQAAAARHQIQEVDLNKGRITNAVKKGIYSKMKFAFTKAEIAPKSAFFYAFFNEFDIGHYDDPGVKLAQQIHLWTDKSTNLQKLAYNSLKELRHNAKHGVKKVMTSKLHAYSLVVRGYCCFDCSEAITVQFFCRLD